MVFRAPGVEAARGALSPLPDRRVQPRARGEDPYVRLRGARARVSHGGEREKARRAPWTSRRGSGARAAHWALPPPPPPTPASDPAIGPASALLAGRGSGRRQQRKAAEVERVHVHRVAQRGRGEARQRRGPADAGGGGELLDALPHVQLVVAPVPTPQNE